MTGKYAILTTCTLCKVGWSHLKGAVAKLHKPFCKSKGKRFLLHTSSEKNKRIKEKICFKLSMGVDLKKKLGSSAIKLQC